MKVPLRQVRSYNRVNMHCRWAIPFVFALVTTAFCADKQQVSLLPCPTDGKDASACNPSKQDLEEARAAFSQALKLQKEKHWDEAFDQFKTAAILWPRNLEYFTAREMALQQLVYFHLEQGNKNLLQGRQIEALAEFRNAAQLDPENKFAQQRLRDALGNAAPKISEPPRVLEDAGILQVAPAPGRREFHFRGDSRELLTQVTRAFGITTTFDDSVLSRRVRYDIDLVDFDTAMSAACAVTHTFWFPLQEKQIVMALDTPENHKKFDRMAMRTFYIPGASSPQDLTDISNLLRNVLDLRFITPQPQAGVLVVRAPEHLLDAATQLLLGLGDGRPQVLLDVHVYEVSHTLTRNIGVHIPNQFQLFNIPAGALAALGGQNIQDLINQLIASGGINAGSSQSLQALLAQLQSQQNSIFSQPLATFGGGMTLMGLSLDTLGAQLSRNESSAKTLEHVTLRVAQGNEATFHLGTRYPILNASFAPIYNTPAIANVIQNNSYQAAFPSYSYEDLGLNLKAKPTVNGALDVALQLEMQLRTLTGQSSNGVPVISNREYKGSIMLKDGEPAVVAGEVSRTEQRGMSGMPGLSAVPVLKKVATSNNKEVDEDELLIVITPHVVSRPDRDQNTEVWVTK